MNLDSTTPEIHNQVANPLGSTPARTSLSGENLEAADCKRPFLQFRFQVAIFIFVLATVFCVWSTPWQALECGPDEGMEFSKMQLLLQHPEMAKLAWNDQSWFYSQLFTAIFKMTGFQCGIPRLTTVVIVGCMLFAFLRLMPRGVGWLHLTCAWLFFWCWPQMPHLVVSAMLEMPAIGLVIIAAALTPRDRTEWQWWRFGLAGIIFAVAVQIKLTALIILPALGIKMAWLWWREIRYRQDGQTSLPSNDKNRWWLPPILGLIVCVTLYGLIACWSPTWDWSQIWGSHLAADSTTQANKYRLEPQYLLQSPGILIAALLGIIVLSRKRLLHEAVFPLALLATVFIVHSNHHPWWYYYGIHFAIPLAILGGWGTAELLREGIQNLSDPTTTAQLVFKPEISMMLGSLAVSLWAGFELSRSYENTRLIYQEERIADNDTVNELKKYQGQVKWAFSQRSILVAQSGCVMPPELTILAKKRFWTGKINDKMILDNIKRYQCEVLILFADKELKAKAWNQFLEDDYVKTWTEGNECIFVAKRLNPAPEPKRNDLFKHLDL